MVTALPHRPRTRSRRNNATYGLAPNRYNNLVVTSLFPLQLFLATSAGWTNRHQARVIDYLVEENCVLKEQIGSKRLCLTDDQRRRLVVKGHALGRRLLGKVATIVTPDTILRWHHKLIAMKWTFAKKRTGRPGIMKEIRELIVLMATSNSSLATNASKASYRSSTTTSPARPSQHPKGPRYPTKHGTSDYVEVIPQDTRRVQ